MTLPELLAGMEISLHFLSEHVASIELPARVSIEASRKSTDEDIRVVVKIDLANGNPPIVAQTRFPDFLDLLERLKIDPEAVVWHHRPRDLQTDPITYLEELQKDLESIDRPAAAGRKQEHGHRYTLTGPTTGTDPAGTCTQ